MAKIQTIPPVPSYWDWMALFRVMADPDAYQQKLMQLEALRDEINAQIQVRESVSQLESIKAEETAALQAAKDELAKAKAEAAAITAAAKLEAEQLRREGAADRAAIEAQRAEVAGKLQRKQADLDAMAKSTQELADRSQLAFAEGQDAKRKADVLRAEYEKKLAALKGLVE